MTTKISMLAIDLAKGSFQVCAVGPDGVVSREWWKFEGGVISG